jgi:hypothetical protein
MNSVNKRQHNGTGDDDCLSHPYQLITYTRKYHLFDITACRRLRNFTQAVRHEDDVSNLTISWPRSLRFKLLGDDTV